MIDFYTVDDSRRTVYGLHLKMSIKAFLERKYNDRYYLSNDFSFGYKSKN